MSVHKLHRIDKSRDHERVFLDHYDWLLAWSRQLTRGSKEEAEDLVQDLYVRFVQSKSELDLTDEDRLRGYLYRTLKHLFISRKLRNGRDALSSLLVVDFDSLESALWAVDRSRLLLVRSDLASICEYACIRRRSHRAASALILRFFLGYLPSEIAKVFQANRAAVDKLIQTARTEARVFLTRPGTLHFMGNETKRGRAFDSHLPDDPTALYSELRRRIFAEAEGICPGPSELEQTYSGTESRLSTPTLAHLVSCVDCLDRANTILELPTLEQRFSSGDGDQGDGDPPTMLIDRNHGAKLRKKLQETFEHRPSKLQIAVNGEVRWVQVITSTLSTFQIKLEALASVEFVEVLSEQGIRLLYHSFEEADISIPTEQSVEVELSDYRKLAIAVALDDGVPMIEVSYSDPLMGEAPMLEISPLPSHSGEPDRQGRNRPNLHSRWRRLSSWLKELDWFWTRNLAFAVALGAILILALFVADNRRASRPPLSAVVILHQSAEKSQAAIPTGGAVHTVFAYEVRSPEGQVLESGKIDALRGRAPQRTAIKLISPAGRVVRGHWNDGKGKDTAFPAEDKKTPARVSPLVRDAWAHVPDVVEFGNLVGEVEPTQVVLDANRYALSFTRSTASPSPGVTSAHLVLSANDLRPVEESFELQDGEVHREYRFKELSFEVLPASPKLDRDFDIDPELIRSSSDAISTISSGTSAHLVLQAFQLLNNLGPDVERLVDLDRLPDGSVQISGVLPTNEQRTELLHVFGSLRNDRQIKLSLHSSDEVPVSTEVPHATTVEAFAPVAVDQNRPPLDAELRRTLKERGLSGSDLDEKIRQLSGEALRYIADLHREGWTIRQIATHDFSVEELQSLPPDDRMLWLTLLDKHIRAFAQDRQSLELAFAQFHVGNATGVREAPAPILQPKDVRELGAVAESLNLNSDRLDRLLTAGLTLSPIGSPTTHNVAEIAELLADLRIEESMLHETVARLQAARP